MAVTLYTGTASLVSFLTPYFPTIFPYMAYRFDYQKYKTNSIDISVHMKFIGFTSWSKVKQLRLDVVVCNGLQGHSVSWRFSDRQYKDGSCSGGSLRVFELLVFPESSCHSWGRETSHSVLAISSHPQAHSGPLWTEHQISDPIYKTSSVILLNSCQFINTCIYAYACTRFRAQGTKNRLSCICSFIMFFVALQIYFMDQGDCTWSPWTLA